MVVEILVTKRGTWQNNPIVDHDASNPFDDLRPAVAFDDAADRERIVGLL
jgi:hypothetical protein